MLRGTILVQRNSLASNVFVYTKTLALQALVGRSPNPLFCIVPMQASHFCKMLFQHSAGVCSHHGSVMLTGIGIASQQNRTRTANFQCRACSGLCAHKSTACWSNPQSKTFLWKEEILKLATIITLFKQ